MPSDNDKRGRTNGGYSGGFGGNAFGGNGSSNGNSSAGGGPLGAYVPPHSIEAEQSTLGAMLIERSAVEKVFEILDKEDFYRENHQILFDVITFLTERDEPIDLVTVPNELKNRDQLDAIGGMAYLASLFDTVPTAANVEYYAKIVEEKATLRRLISASLEIIGSARGEVEDVGEVLDEAERSIFSVSQQRATAYFSPLRTLLLSVYDKAEELSEMKSKISGLSTGIHDFDMITSGLQSTDLIIVAARPSMGKCVIWNTLIDNPLTGERMTIEDYVRQQLPTVLSLSGMNLVQPKPIGAWIDSGVKPCFRVRTCTGRTVDVTGHHPFLTVHSWTPLHDLAVGSKIAVPRQVPAFGTDESLPRELVRLMAYFIAEGGLTAKSPCFTNTDPVIVDDFQQIIARNYTQCVVRQEDITYKVVRPTRSEWKSSPNPVTVWLQNLGLWGKLAEQKSFPDCVWRWTKPHLAEFLRVLMSCDGTIYNMAGYPRIEFAVASEKLAQDVHHALTRFGIVAKLWQKTPRCWRSRSPSRSPSRPTRPKSAGSAKRPPASGQSLKRAVQTAVICRRTPGVMSKKRWPPRRCRLSRLPAAAARPKAEANTAATTRMFSAACRRTDSRGMPKRWTTMPCAVCPARTSTGTRSSRLSLSASIKFMISASPMAQTSSPKTSASTIPAFACLLLNMSR